MPNPPLTLARMAAKLGVSATTVSAALRGRPGVSTTLRDRIVAHAREVGYAPNPAMAEWMNFVHIERAEVGRGNLVAFVTSFADPGLLDRIYTFNAFMKGADRRGADFGYHVEPFHGLVPGMTGELLTESLKARGVRGILLGPPWMDGPRVELDLKQFSVVLIGEVYHRDNIYRVCNNHLQSCNLALNKLDALGYRHIAVTSQQRYEGCRGYEYMLGVNQYQREAAGSARVSVWRYHEWNGSAFAAWAAREGIDCVVSLDPVIWETVRDLRDPSGNPVGYANLDVRPDTPFSGIDQHSALIGETGMELLRQLLLAGERGAALHPQTVLIDGTWIEGSTTRRTAPRA